MRYFYPPKEILSFHSFLEQIPASASENGYAQLILEYLSPSQTYIWASNQNVHIQFFIGEKCSIPHNFDFQKYVIAIQRDAISNFIAKNSNKLFESQKFLDWDEHYDIIEKRRCSLFQKTKEKIETFIRYSPPEQNNIIGFPFQLFTQFFDILQPFPLFYLEKRRNFYAISANLCNTWVKIIIDSWIIEKRRYNYGNSNLTRKTKGNYKIFQ